MLIDRCGNFGKLDKRGRGKSNTRIDRSKYWYVVANVDIRAFSVAIDAKKKKAPQWIWEYDGIMTFALTAHSVRPQ